MTRLAYHLRIGTAGNIAERFATALYFANLDLIEQWMVTP